MKKPKKHDRQIDTPVKKNMPMTDPAGAGVLMLTSRGFLLMGTMAHHFFRSTVRIRHGMGSWTQVKPMASMASAPDGSPRDDVSRKDREGRSGAEANWAAGNWLNWGNWEQKGITMVYGTYNYN